MLHNPSTQLWYMNGTQIPYMNNNNTINTISKIHVTPYNTKQNVVSQNQETGCILILVFHYLRL
jgi:hypothetical protein